MLRHVEPKGPPLRTNFVLIDYENVQPDTLSALSAEHFKIILFVGASQNKLTFTTVDAMHKLGDKAQYVKIAGNGSNALDFHIAFYIGQISALDPTAYFHIISKDAGFDPLIQHLKERKVSVARSGSVADIPLLRAANCKTVPEMLAVIIPNIQQRGASKPRTLKTLTSTINALFQRQLSEQDLVAVLKALEHERFITIAGTKVTYSSAAAG